MAAVSSLHPFGSPSVTRTTAVMTFSLACCVAHCVAPASAAYIGVWPAGVLLWTAVTSASCCGSECAGCALSSPTSTSGVAHASTLHALSLQPLTGSSSGKKRNATFSPADSSSWKNAVSAAVAPAHFWSLSLIHI